MDFEDVTVFDNVVPFDLLAIVFFGAPDAGKPQVFGEISVDGFGHV